MRCLVVLSIGFGFDDHATDTVDQQVGTKKIGSNRDSVSEEEVTAPKD